MIIEKLKKNRFIWNLNNVISPKKRVEYFISRIMFIPKYKRNTASIKSFNNIHKGKRCFIIGNGPSLLPKDLDMLKNEITFATNRIYNIFDKTEWRPTYYCMVDDGLLSDKKNNENVKRLVNSTKFLRMQKYLSIKNYYPEDIYIKTKWSRRYLKKPKFSMDSSKEVYTIATVTYTAIQLAVYMGIREIYLLGVDNNYALERNSKGEVVINNNIKSYFSGNSEDQNSIAARYEMDIVYEFLKEYSEKHDIRIYNSTRGGRLEVFERKKIESLL